MFKLPPGSASLNETYANGRSAFSNRESPACVSSHALGANRSFLAVSQFNPWRHHLWLSAKVPPDEHFARSIQELVEFYTRLLTEGEMALFVDEKTHLQPRRRKGSTLPARPGQPTRLEHDYKRGDALHLFGAFDTRTGKVYARTDLRKRQVEFMALLHRRPITYSAQTLSSRLIRFLQKWLER